MQERRVALLQSALVLERASVEDNRTCRGRETASAACARRRLECEWLEMLRTHYEILKITRDAPQEVVRAAYRALTLKYHPDRHAADPGATDMMAQLNSAYETLSDPLKRRE
jgi:DnaJ-domain-containing protein 1